MKKHALWLALAVAALAVAAGYLLRRKPSSRAAMPSQAAVPPPKPTVALEDGKTIDFSSGAPVVKDTAVEKAIIERAVHQINAAAQNVSFSSPTKSADAKKAESEKAPPK